MEGELRKVRGNQERGSRGKWEEMRRGEAGAVRGN